MGCARCLIFFTQKITTRPICDRLCIWMLYMYSICSSSAGLASSQRAHSQMHTLRSCVVIAICTFDTHTVTLTHYIHVPKNITLRVRTVSSVSLCVWHVCVCVLLCLWMRDCFTLRALRDLRVRVREHVYNVCVCVCIGVRPTFTRRCVQASESALHLYMCKNSSKHNHAGLKNV